MKSPCTSKCVLNENRYCIGCKRTQSEIVRWSKMSLEEKGAIMDKLKERDIDILPHWTEKK